MQNPMQIQSGACCIRHWAADKDSRPVISPTQSSDPDPEPVPGQTAYSPRLSIDLPQTPPSHEMRLTTELELQVVSDLFIVNAGVGKILSRLKSQEGVRDHDDMHRLAEDLLLTRCPSVCREWYPKSVVDALDSLGDKPWQDGHLFRAISASQGNEDVHKDLMRRIGILRDLRRQYRAFIIDEYKIRILSTSGS